MTLIETTIAIVLAQIPTYFIQRYLFKHIIDKSLDKIEYKALNKLKWIWGKKK